MFIYKYGSSAISVGRKAKFCQPDSVWTARGFLLAILGEETVWITRGMFVPHIPPVTHTNPQPAHTAPEMLICTETDFQ